MEAPERDRNRWLVVELLRDFLEVWLQFRQIYRRYQQGQLTFEEMASFVDDKDPYLPLFRLKEISHKLFRKPGGDHPEEGRLFDLAVGSIFHEAMKARENLYQLQAYRPYYVELQRREAVTPYQRRLYAEFSKIGHRAERGLREGLAETRRLFKDTLEQIRAFLVRGWRDNALLVRFILRHEDLLRRAYGKRGFESLVAEAFPEGFAAALKEGALSFMKGEHFAEAERLFKRYLRYRPEDLEAYFLRLYCRGFDAYLGNRYRVTLRAFRRAGEVARRGTRAELKGYLERMAEVVTRIARELHEEGRSRRASKVLSLVEELRTLSLA